MPSGADASTALPVTSSTWPEVSIIPPLPPSDPPLASRVPATCVVPSDHTAIVPPSPCLDALERSVAPEAMVTLVA